ncbi:ras association domain-containing protein 2-like, partial [Scleropages formosus]
EEGELIVEGLLSVSWGLRRPIRLKMQDEKDRIRPPPSSTSWHSGCSLEAQRSELTEGAEDSPQLLRTRSDVGVWRRSTRRSPGDQRRIRRHRFSINGHYYNHKTAVFTPTYGSVTNVRINSCMSTSQVLRVLLNKFKIENSPDDFTLFLVHTSGERVQLKRTDHPLVVRILEGPCEQVSKIFIMEKDLGEEITYSVAQYIKFEMPVLQTFITKLKEEEDREVQKLRSRYHSLRRMIEKQLQCLTEGPTCMGVFWRQLLAREPRFLEPVAVLISSQLPLTWESNVNIPTKCQIHSYGQVNLTSTGCFNPMPYRPSCRISQSISTRQDVLQGDVFIFYVWNVKLGLYSPTVAEAACPNGGCSEPKPNPATRSVGLEGDTPGLGYQSLARDPKQDLNPKLARKKDPAKPAAPPHPPG